LEKDYGYKDSHFEFIQQHLRRTCLQRKCLTATSSVAKSFVADGASLIYSSIRKEINVELLLQYLQHLLFGMEFTHTPQLIQRDAIFVPAGWDSLNKIEV
jgi:dynein light intermediate chain 1